MHNNTETFVISDMSYSKSAYFSQRPFVVLPPPSISIFPIVFDIRNLNYWIWLINSSPTISNHYFTTTMALSSSTTSTPSYFFNDREEKENVPKAIENPLLLRSPPARPNTNNHYGSNASEDNGNHLEGGGALTVYSQNGEMMGLRQRKFPHGDSFGPPPRASLSMGTVVDFLPPTKQDVSAPVRV
jgi:hypothetical protein